MARRIKNQKKSEETLVDIIEVRNQAQDFLEANQKWVYGILGGVLLIIGGVWAYKNLYQKPRQAEAVEQMFQAQMQFERDSFALALTNPGGGYSGLLDIIDNYKGTKAANLANYYAGICYLRLGQYEAAADYLKTFKPAGKIGPIMKYGALADALSELNQLDDALSTYKKAVDAGVNDAITPYYLKKYGMLSEKLGKYGQAKEAYERIKRDFPSSPIATDIDKYIIRAGARG